jgi:hypothetical protein
VSPQAGVDEVDLAVLVNQGEVHHSVPGVRGVLKNGPSALEMMTRVS